MSKTNYLFGMFLLLGSLVSFVAAQTPAPAKYDFAAGEVDSISSNRIVVKTKDGSLDAVLTDKTEYKKLPAVNPSLKTAVPAAFADIGAGDKIVVVGLLIALMLLSKNYIKVSPNQAAVISGRTRRLGDGTTVGYRQVRGGATLTMQRMPYESSFLRTARTASGPP